MGQDDSCPFSFNPDCVCVYVLAYLFDVYLLFSMLVLHSCVFLCLGTCFTCALCHRGTACFRTTMYVECLPGLPYVHWHQARISRMNVRDMDIRLVSSGLSCTERSALVLNLEQVH